MSWNHSVAIVMSRLPRLIDPQATWLRGLRAALRQVRRCSQTLIVVDETAGSVFVRRGAERLGIPIEIISADSANFQSGTETDIPSRDRVLLSAAQAIIVLGLRPHGNVHHAVQERLQKGGHVELVDLPGLQSDTVREDLTRLGAVLWSPTEDDQVPFDSLANSSAHATPTDFVYEISPCPPRDEWAYLSHSTRACPGPWPGQPQTDYLDALLDNSPDADHCARAALERILTQRQLRASPLTIREGHPMVCFTAVPLIDLPKRRQFRTHRTRWDFEPFGLCIRRQWLQDRGVRQVIYGDESTWRELTAAERPFYQLRHPEASIDWSVEREWRHPGDLDLRELKSDEALVFVDSYEVARRLTGISPWPITLWPGIAVEDPSEGLA